MNFVKRTFRIVFELGEGSFTGKPEDNRIELSGLRIHANIRVSPFSALDEAHIVVFGLKADTMNALTLIKGTVQINLLKPNTVSLYAQDETGNDILVFSGMIFQALADYNSMPTVPMHIFAMSSFKLNTAPPNAISFNGSVTVPQIIQTILDNYNATRTEAADKYVLENNGVTTSLTDVALSGSYKEMILSVARQANISVQFEGNTVVIVAAGQSRAITPITISVETGMIGYPSLIPNGCIVRTLFSPYYRWLAPVTVKSRQVLFQKGMGKEIGASEAECLILKMSHRLQSETPNGLWQTELQLIYKLTSS